MKKKIVLLLSVTILCGSFVGCGRFFRGSETKSDKEEVNIEEIKNQIKEELKDSQENSNEEEKSSSKDDKEKEDDKENKDITVNINNTPEVNEQKPPTVIVRETIPSSVYHSNSFIFPDSSSIYLTKIQVSYLSNYQLGIARNEIYARHGYIFQMDQFRRYFESQDWYVPRVQNQSNITLNNVEKYNIDVIKNEENRRGVTW